MVSVLSQRLISISEATITDRDLNAIVRTVCERASRLGKTIKTDLKPLPEFPLRPVAIQRLITNLVDNALVHGGGDVEVQTWCDAAHVYLSVLDRGPDIPEAERARMLEPFTRLDPSRGAGSGLGLAIADRIARLDHGEVTLLSRAGGGLEAHQASAEKRAVREGHYRLRDLIRPAASETQSCLIILKPASAPHGLRREVKWNFAYLLYLNGGRYEVYRD